MSEEISKRLTSFLISDLKVLDMDLAKAAFNSKPPVAPFNMTIDEAKRVGGAGGSCDGDPIENRGDLPPVGGFVFPNRAERSATGALGGEESLARALPGDELIEERETFRVSFGQGRGPHPAQRREGADHSRGCCGGRGRFPRAQPRAAHRRKPDFSTRRVRLSAVK